MGSLDPEDPQVCEEIQGLLSPLKFSQALQEILGIPDLMDFLDLLDNRDVLVLADPPGYPVTREDKVSQDSPDFQGSLVRTGAEGPRAGRGSPASRGLPVILALRVSAQQHLAVPVYL